MKQLKYLVLGAGPSGLTTAYALIKYGVPENQLLLLEKESAAGGLCRSEQVDGAPLDIGGGHFLDTRNQKVLHFLFSFLPAEEWNAFDRVSKIYLRGQEIDYPLEANLWQLPKAGQVDFLESIAKAGSVRGEAIPSSFAAWVEWKLGKLIAGEYMLPYNRKIWSMDLNLLGTYWLHKLPSVSFRDTLRSCLESRPCGTLPGHATFLYPKRFGYGELWRRIGEKLGPCLLTNCPVESIDPGTRTINEKWQAETIISTIPWTLWPGLARLPEDIQHSINKLCSTAINIDYIAENLTSPAYWIYDPAESVPHHRLILRSNFCPGSRGYYTETNADRSKTAAGWRHSNKFSYPVNTISKPQAIAHILQWAAGNRIYGLGRWGKWEHMNSDVAVADALDFAAELFTNKLP